MRLSRYYILTAIVVALFIAFAGYCHSRVYVSAATVDGAEIKIRIDYVSFFSSDFYDIVYHRKTKLVVAKMGVAYIYENEQLLKPAIIGEGAPGFIIDVEVQYPEYFLELIKELDRAKTEVLLRVRAVEVEKAIMAIKKFKKNKSSH
ncbi:MAG: hypothetical protein Q8Q06_02095 [bacterium]|nr:hypothetical protein [bacterium]